MLNFKKVKESLFLILVAVAVGLIVSAVAQLFMIVAKDIFAFIFQNKNQLYWYQIRSKCCH